jgi:HK97 family phage portal protein
MSIVDRLLRRRDRSGVVAEERSWMDVFKVDAGWFQKALDQKPLAVDISTNTAVYACVNIISQEVASLATHHWKVRGDGSRQRVKGSNPERVLRKPNKYQTRSDFWMFVMRALLLGGAGYVYAPRNNRTEVAALHPLPSRCTPMVGPNGDVYYSISTYDTNLAKVAPVVPAYYMFNPRINCFRHPLVGETPITAFVNAAVAGGAIQRAVSRFFLNQSRPSGVLMSPKPLTKVMVDQIRSQWNELTQGEAAGKTPLLPNDIKWQQITMSAADAQTIATYQLTVADIAMAYRVPLFMLGDLSKGSFNNVESMMRVFYTSSLRFYLEHLENALNALFELDGEQEYLEFDIETALQRGNLDARINALTKAIQGGIMSPNEARAREELAPLAGGEDLFMQRQMTPVPLLVELTAAELKKKLEPPPPPKPPPAPPPTAPAPSPEAEPAEESEVSPPKKGVVDQQAVQRIMEIAL